MANSDLSEERSDRGSQDAACADAKKPAPVSEDRMKRLVRTIEGEIVPRLVVARRVRCLPQAVPVRGNKPPDPLDVSELVRLLLAHDVGVASAFVETVRQRGATLEMVCMNLLAPAARQLGVMWEQDECDFMQVTVGLCRLHQLLRELSPEFRTEEEDCKSTRRVLLVPCPGDQHTFGISLVAQFLRRAGWDVWHEFPASSAEILEIVGNHWLTVVGLSVGTETHLDEVAATIRAIRSVSRNRAVGVLVGGPLLVDRPALALLVGADATAPDGPQAVLRAEHVCSALANAN
jgi:methanogenic corrinoid protein MtbC1